MGFAYMPEGSPSHLKISASVLLPVAIPVTEWCKLARLHACKDDEQLSTSK